MEQAGWIAQLRRYEFLFSAVAYDQRNTTLQKCFEKKGLANIITDWQTLFPRSIARCASFTHQEWVAWVAEHDTDGDWIDWLEYVKGLNDL